MNLILVLIVIALISFYFARRAYRKRSAGSVFHENVVLKIRVPKANEKGALAAEQMFSSIHGLLKVKSGIQEHISFEIVGSSDGIHFYAVTPRNIKDFIESQIYAQYPNAEIREVDDYLPEVVAKGFVKAAHLVLAKDYFLPIRTFRDFEVDPLAAITSSLSKLESGEVVAIQLLVRPLADVWQAAGREYVSMVRSGTLAVTIGVNDLKNAIIKELLLLPNHFFKALLRPGEPHPPPERVPPSGTRLSPGAELSVKAIDQKLSKLGFETNIRVVSVSGSEASSSSRLRGTLASFRQFSTADVNSFESRDVSAGDIGGFVKDSLNRHFDDDFSYILTNEELGTVFHLPSISVETPTISWTPSKRGEPPLNLPVEDCTYLGKTTFRESLVRFGIKREDRRRHLYVIGKTGTGKTTLFENMVIQDMKNGEGLAVIDPHGDFVERMLDFVPENRVNDVVILDPGDYDFPVSLNMLEISDPRQKNLMASGLVDAFKKHFSESWGPRLEYILNNSILTLLEVPNTTLLGVTRLLSDDNYQKYINYKMKDPIIKHFWEVEYREMKGNQKLITEAIAPIQNKVGRFLASSTIRNIVGQAKSTIKLDEIMNTGKLLFINLSKGKIGEDNSNLLGSLLISRLQFTAMQRVMMPENERRDFYVYADEFQNIASGSFANILSEARKYRLNLNLAHQYIEQLPEEMSGAVFGNVGSVIAFGVGAADARVLAKEFVPVFEEGDLISLERFHMSTKLMVDGMTSQPFSAITLPITESRTNNREKVIALSRSRYGTDVSKVEERIRIWAERQFTLGLAKAEEMRSLEGKPEDLSQLLAETQPQVPEDASGEKIEAVTSANRDEISVDRLNFPPSPPLEKRETAAGLEEKKERVVSGSRAISGGEPQGLVRLKGEIIIDPVRKT